MNLDGLLDQVSTQINTSGQTLAIVLAGHNGSGKSTLWRRKLSDRFQIPLINADRMMLSILPEPNRDGVLSVWARNLRDTHQDWMIVAQKGVRAFIDQAIDRKLPFATETVFSHWVKRPDGGFDSKIDLIKYLQERNYFVLMVFVGLNDVRTSLSRVETRISDHGHAVPEERLRERFSRTQQAIRAAIPVVDAAILLDNSRSPSAAFTVCQVQTGGKTLYDIRTSGAAVPVAISQWLDIVGA